MLAFAISIVLAAAPPAIQVAGDLPKHGALTRAELEQLGAVTAKWKDHGAEHTVVGAPLDKVLAHFGFDRGPMGPDMPRREKRSGWKLAVVASAPDGFQAAFSAAELTEGMGPTRALVIWSLDGKPLPAAMGPFRLVVLTDGEPSRSLYQLARIDVVDLRKVIPPAAP